MDEMDESNKIVWAISAYAQRHHGFNITIGHWPVSRNAASAAEAKGLGLEWLAEYKPHSEGWQNYDVSVCPVYSSDHERLIVEGKATS